MKKEVEDLLKKGQEQKNAFEKQKRDKHLISIGLIDKEKASRIYSGHYYSTSEFNLHDPEKKQSYKEVFGALDVTDEEYAEICKYFPPKSTTTQTKLKSTQQSATAEETLSLIAGIVLAIGIVVSAILLLIGVRMVIEYEYGGWLFLLGIPIILLPSITTWAFTKVFSNISLTLKEINKKVK